MNKLLKLIILIGEAIISIQFICVVASVFLETTTPIKYNDDY